METEGMCEKCEIPLVGIDAEPSSYSGRVFCEPCKQAYPVCPWWGRRSLKVKMRYKAFSERGELNLEGTIWGCDGKHRSNAYNDPSCWARIYEVEQQIRVVIDRNGVTVPKDKWPPLRRRDT